MSTVYLGTSDFAAAVLERLAASPYRPALVITRPDRPRGRGRKLAAPPVADAARRLGLELEQPQDVGDEPTRAAIAAREPEVVLLCAFGALIKEPLLSQHLMINVHPSLLPRWRGAAPIERAIMTGDAQTGVSIMQVTAGLDSGPIYGQWAEPIAGDDTYGALAPRLAASGAELLLEVLEARPPGRPQDDAQATYAEKITGVDRRLRPELSAAELERIVRALHPHIGAYLEIAPVGRLGVLQARVAVGGPEPAPGTLWLEGPLPVLGTAAGALELRQVQPPGGRPMAGEEYLRGHRPRQ